MLIKELLFEAPSTKEKMVVFPWAREMKQAIKSMRIPATALMAGEDGYWVKKEKAEAAIAELVAAGFKKGRSSKKWVVIKSKESPKLGMTFDFDDPDAKGMVGVRFYDEDYGV
jgi:hypothetical protein